MRIISGSHKGKRLTAPKSLPVRPTTDFAKEALFNILNHRIAFHEIKLLDLFSGTGNISYEFASRGCEQITAVDSHYGCVKYISETAKELDFTIQTAKADVYKFLETTRDIFDVVFADPPYDFDIQKLGKMVEIIFERGLLKTDGFVIIEHTKHNDLSQITGFTEARRYGGSVFSFFGKTEM
ncbi:methyltransferase [Patiriisocius marinistellae]|uniref:Methyltransferase n=1 Tax=Patiriisocius marinistellae TaxID=2494560 RepID=A0A5J4G299_9FLAO|nr:RsmD family RNA methyltransferase [Patiriisocius marinistellae]GEQ86271.1 methyltransferase [Patiriisocius marinistellae]